MLTVWPSELYDKDVIAEWTYSGWFTVENDEGVVALFMSEKEAEAYVTARATPTANFALDLSRSSI